MSLVGCRSAASDGEEGRQRSKLVRSHSLPTLGSVATSLKLHKMEDFYVTDHEVDMK